MGSSSASSPKASLTQDLLKGAFPQVLTLSWTPVTGALVSASPSLPLMPQPQPPALLGRLPGNT